ncbi:MAG: hypothetical protein GXO19_04580 [Epsilonproteobacteria bacterium]|nr:hypothetical protein [Campylobacterota bacterium]
MVRLVGIEGGLFNDSSSLLTFSIYWLGNFNNWFRLDGPTNFTDRLILFIKRDRRVGHLFTMLLHLMESEPFHPFGSRLGSSKEYHSKGKGSKKSFSHLTSFILL